MEDQVVEKKEKKVPPSTPAKYVGFWSRLGAFIIDYFVIVVASKIMFGDRVVTFSEGTLSTSFDGIFIFIPILYFVLFWKFFNATPGKMALKIKIVPIDEKSELSWKNVILRFLGYIVSALAIFIGFFWIGFDKKKQGWHDKIGKTLVIKK